MIFDLHNDFATVLDKSGCERYLRTTGSNKITAAIWTSELNCAAEKTQEITDMLSRINGRGKICIAIEDIGFTSECDLYKKFEFSKYLYCSLTWNYDNAFAGGALDGGNLTDKGKHVIDIINDTSCVLDLAHLNKKSFYSALERANKVICSHTGFNGHLRSLDDMQIRELISKGGIIGLCAVTAFSGARDEVEFIAVIDRFVQKYGIDNLAIGTDFYGSKDIPESINDYKKFECIFVGLSRYGYSETDIGKIFCNNALNFFY